MIHFKEITKENLFKVLELSVFDHQKDQVAPNGDSIAVGLYYPEFSWVRAIYNDDNLIGFLVLYLNNNKETYKIWRFMIDKNYQGKGYGKTSMHLIIKIFKEKIPKIKEIQLSYVPKVKGGADEFYKKMGFEETGQMIGEENIMTYKY